MSAPHLVAADWARRCELYQDHALRDTSCAIRLAWHAWHRAVEATVLCCGTESVRDGDESVRSICRTTPDRWARIC